MNPEMGERQILARIDNVSIAIEKAEPEQLGKAIRLLDAMKRLAVGKKWVGTIGNADAWCLKARRRAGEIVEATPTGEHTLHGRQAGGKVLREDLGHPRKDVREELGISEHESKSWQALAKIPEKTFDEFVEKVRMREEDGTISNALAYAKAEAGEPETHVRVVKKRSPDEILMQDLNDAVERLMEVSAFETLESMQDAKHLHMAVELLERTAEFLQRQAKKLIPALKELNA
jgi:hypothetical protein